MHASWYSQQPHDPAVLISWVDPLACKLQIDEARQKLQIEEELNHRSAAEAEVLHASLVAVQKQVKVLETASRDIEASHVSQQLLLSYRIKQIELNLLSFWIKSDISWSLSSFSIADYNTADL